MLSIMIFGVIIGISKVNALELPESAVIKINNNQVTTTNRIFTSAGNVNLAFTSPSTWTPDNYPQYAYIALCEAIAYPVPTWTSGSYSRNFKAIVTNSPCQMYNTNAYPDSRIIYFTFEFNYGNMCNVNLQNCVLDNTFTFYQQGTQEFTLIGYGASTEPFIINGDSGLIITQNKQIISGLGAVSNGISSVNNNILDLNDTLDQDHTYNNNASENINGQDEIDDLSDAEEDLLNDLDFSGAEDLDITINPQASSFIWEIVNQLRQMNEAIILLITSILGLGIIKMILNR